MHFQSSRAQNETEATYRILREACVYESEGFAKILSVMQSGLPITVESARGVLHLEEQNNTLKIFVPRDQRDRRLCYMNQLPKDLIAHLGITDAAARGVFQNVLGSDMDILDDILEGDGIIQVELDPSLEGVGDVEPDEAISEVAASDFSSDHAGPRPVPRPATAQEPGSDADPDGSINPTPSTVTYLSERSRPSSIQNGNAFDIPAVSRQQSINVRQNVRVDIFGRQEEEEEISLYTRLLIQVATAARNATFDIGTIARVFLSIPSVSATLSNSPFGNRSRNQLDHDIRVGAAGELFVSHILPLQQNDVRTSQLEILTMPNPEFRFSNCSRV